MWVRRVTVTHRLPPKPGETMKTIATLVISVLLSLGMLVAPAHAEDVVVPTSCDQSAQEWRTLASSYYDMLEIEKSQVEDGNRTIERLAKRVNRKQAKIADLWKTIHELRR